MIDIKGLSFWSNNLDAPTFEYETVGKTESNGFYFDIHPTFSRNFCNECVFDLIQID